MSDITFDTLSKARARLLVDSPYFGTLAGRLELVPSENMQGFLSDGLKLQYNPDYVDGLDADETAFMLANGAMHAALRHERRQLSRMSWLWQLATDHAINAMLVQNGMTLPPMVAYEARFDGMYAEEIYAALKDEIRNEEYDDDERNDTGFNENDQQRRDPLKNGEGNHDQAGKRPTMEVENSIDETLFAEMAKALEKELGRRGELPLGLQRLFERTHDPRIDWRSELHHALNRHLHSDFRLIPPSRKLLYQGIYLPAADSQHLELIIAVDSSGSVDAALLGRFITEVESLLETFPHYRVTLLTCDARIQSAEYFEPGEPISYTIKGGGGTDFRPVFAWIDINDPDAALLLYFTDLDGRFPDDIPRIDTVWVTSKEDGDVPFGRVICIGDQS